MADVFLWDHVIHSPLSDAASLAAIDVTGYVNGVVANVIGVGVFTYNNSSSATADNVTVIDPTAGPGRWLITPVNIGTSNSILATTGSAGATSAIAFTPLARTLAAESAASDFRAEISAASSGANSDITSLSGLTTALSVPQGGSGAVSLTGILVGNGASAFTTVTAPSGAIVGTTDSQVLTNKTIALASNTLTGVAASGANSDITSLSGLTTPLSASQGGTGVNSLGSGVATFLQTPTSANLATAVTDDTGSGSLVFATSPSLVTPLLGTPTSGTLTNCTGYSANSLAGTTLASSVVTASLTSLLSPVAIGKQGVATGSASLVGTTSGSVTIQPQAAAGTYNFNIPTTAGSPGQFMTSQGGGSTAMTWANAVVRVVRQAFTSSGTYTPSSGMMYCLIQLVGGGGGTPAASGATNISSGGGGGGYATVVETAASIGASQVVTIGAGGIGNQAGGATSVGSLCSATGGSQGVASTSPTFGGVGGSNIVGFGFNGSNGGASISNSGGGGGASFFSGSNNTGAPSSGNSGFPGLIYGCGASGGWNNASSRNGAQGVVVITEYCNQ